MPTATASAPTRESQIRETRLDKFVVLDALQGVVDVLLTIPDGDTAAHAHGISRDNLSVGQEFETDRDLCDELWPTTRELDENTEFVAANRRARMLEARLLIYLARSSDELLEEATKSLDRLDRFERARAIWYGEQAGGDGA